MSKQYKQGYFINIICVHKQTEDVADFDTEPVVAKKDEIGNYLTLKGISD